MQFDVNNLTQHNVSSLQNEITQYERPTKNVTPNMKRKTFDVITFCAPGLLNYQPTPSVFESFSSLAFALHVSPYSFVKINFNKIRIYVNMLNGHFATRQIWSTMRKKVYFFLAQVWISLPNLIAMISSSELTRMSSCESISDKRFMIFKAVMSRK